MIVVLFPPIIVLYLSVLCLSRPIGVQSIEERNIAEDIVYVEP